MPDIIICDGCGKRSPLFYAVDQWAILDNKRYCTDCCKTKLIGWYAKPKDEE
jgi:hypothetical protein